MTNSEHPSHDRAPVRPLQGIIASIREYIKLQIGGDRAGLGTLRDLLRGGVVNWLALAVLGLTVAGAAYMAVPSQAFPVVQFEYWPGEFLALPSPAIYVFLLAFALAWALMLTAVAGRGLGLYVLIATYAAYYTMYVGITLGKSIVFIIPPLWLLILGAWVAAAKPSRWRIPLLAVLCFIVAVITRPGLGIKFLKPNLLGWGLLAAVYLALVANPWVLRKRTFRPRLAFAITAAVFAAFYGLLAVRTPQEVLLPNAFLAAYDLLGFVGLFWYWLGLDLFNGALDLASWLGETAQRIVPRKPLRVLVFIFWGLAALFSYLWAHTPPLAVIKFFYQFGWGQRLLLAYMAARQPSLALYGALSSNLYVLLAIVALAIVLAAVKKLSDARLLSLLGLSILSFLVLLGYQELMLSEVAETTVAAGFWPVLVYVGGMVWQLIKAGGDLAKGEFKRTWLFLGFLLFFGGISLLEITAHYPYFDRQLSLNSFLGVLYLGLPYMLYTLVYRQLKFEPLPVRRLVLLFALGMVSAIPSLVLHQLWVAPLVWLAILLVTSWRWGGWQRPWDALVAGAATGLGFASFYTHPIFVSLPAFLSFLKPILQAEMTYSQNTIWPWQSAWWWAMLFATVACGAIAVSMHLAKARRSIGS